MRERIAKRQTLFSVPPAPSTETVLFAARCSKGHVFFPRQKLGCEVCGAHGDQIEDIEFPASGTLRTFALANRQQRPGATTPLIIGTVILDAGPAVEVVLDVEDTSGLSGGQRVTGHLVEVGEDESGRQIVDCFFSPSVPPEAAG